MREETPTIIAGGVVTTLGHQFVSPDGNWKKVRYLNEAITKTGETMPLNRTGVIGKDTVYNLRIEGLHTYFVEGRSSGKSCFWRVHNQGSKSSSGSMTTSK